LLDCYSCSNLTRRRIGGNQIVIAAGEIVIKSFNENDILIGGVPAKIIKKLGEYEEKTRL